MSLALLNAVSPVNAEVTVYRPAKFSPGNGDPPSPTRGSVWANIAQANPAAVLEKQEVISLLEQRDKKIEVLEKSLEEMRGTLESLKGLILSSK